MAQNACHWRRVHFRGGESTVEFLVYERMNSLYSRYPSSTSRTPNIRINAYCINHWLMIVHATLLWLQLCCREYSENRYWFLYDTILYINVSDHYKMLDFFPRNEYQYFTSTNNFLKSTIITYTYIILV